MPVCGETLQSVALVVVVLLVNDLVGRSDARGLKVGININTAAATGTGTKICRNYDHPISNLTNGAFFCPDRDEPEHYTYCCGESGMQRCCGFYDDPSRAGWAIFGYICAGVPVLVAAVVFSCVLFSKCYHRLKSN